MQVDETIVAVASNHDGGVRGIVRISGPSAVSTVAPLFEPYDSSHQLESLNAARRVAGTLAVREPFGDVECDVYLWPTDRSYTRQPTAELHTFGSPPILNAVVETLCQQGARLARPGEFTLRAFLAGRIDLAQAEAVLGVIDAANERELNVALTQLAGGLSQPLDSVRDTLLNVCADLEAGLDFVDEDIEFISSDQLVRTLADAQSKIEEALEQMRTRGSEQQLPRVVLRGEPNTGKSSLWNAMLGAEDAIVTDVAGTTRDYLVGRVDYEGRSFNIVDTAGVERSEDDLRRAMGEMSGSQAEVAELLLLCIDASRPLTYWEQTELEKSIAGRLVVLTKSDLSRHDAIESVNADIEVQSGDQSSVLELVRRCGEHLEMLGMEANVVSSTAVRCRDALRMVRDSVARATALAEAESGDELVAAELRVALDELGQIVGVIYTDDILDRVFSRFCIGK